MRALQLCLLALAPGFLEQPCIASAQPVHPSCYGPVVDKAIRCPGEGIDPASAINSPTLYAWAVFAEINQPAFPGNATDTRRVWETWRNADNNADLLEAIYLKDGAAPIPWGLRPSGVPPTKNLVAIRQLEMLKEQARDSAFKSFLFLDPLAPLEQETRTNRPAFNFILTNQLYNLQGQYAFASSHPGFDFPPAAKEVKAVWKEARAGLNPADYYSVQNGGKTYLLFAIHVITKDIPFWHWASFVHKDQNLNPSNGYIAPLAVNQDVPASIRGTPFQNYRLLGELAQSASGTALTPTGSGAQIDWITRTGEATVIGNPHIESGFEKVSSCISCHARASIGLSGNGQIVYNNFPLTPGPVRSQEFSKNGVTYFPVDFLWSLRNARSKP